MSDVLQKQLDDLKAELAEARLANETMKQEMEAQKTEAIESQLQTFQETISAKDKGHNDLLAQVEETLTRVKELEEVLAASEAAKEEAIAKFEDLNQETFDFVVSQLTRAGKPPWLDKEKKDDEDKDKKDKKDKKDEKASKADELLEEEIDESEASEEDLDEVEVEDDIAMAEGVDEEDPAVELRASASDWFGGLLKTTANLK